MRRRFTHDLLNTIALKDNAKVIGEYKYLTRDTSISYTCNCGNSHSKSFRLIADYTGMICKVCDKPRSIKKKEETTERNYGVKNPSQSKAIKDKKIETTRKNYGVDNPSQSKTVKDRKTETSKKNYGTEFPTQSEVVKARIEEACMAKYGVRNASQSQEIMERAQKNAKKFKSFVMPSGMIRKVQGYEPFALRDLLEKGYSELQIKTGRLEVPRIPYMDNSKQRYHFPDIWIPHENKLIEVKSTWTYKCRSDNVLLKKKVSQDLGYTYEIWCYNSKGKCELL